MYALHPGRARSLICLPLFLSLPDEIISTLGEGTFGRVVQCIDHRRYVCSWDREGRGGEGKRETRLATEPFVLNVGGGSENESLGFQCSSAGLGSHRLGSPTCWRGVGGNLRAVCREGKGTGFGGPPLITANSGLSKAGGRLCCTG